MADSKLELIGNLPSFAILWLRFMNVQSDEKLRMSLSKSSVTTESFYKVSPFYFIQNMQLFPDTGINLTCLK